MVRNPRLLAAFALVLGVAACAPSPLYVQRVHRGTVGEIPRDGRGEPLFDAIRTPLPPPPAPYVAPAPGTPVTNPYGAVVPPPPAPSTFVAPAADDKQYRKRCRHWRSC